MAARATGSATISFGLVSIPVKLYTATSESTIGFHMLHKTCGTRVKMQLYCPFDKEVVNRRDTVKGYEHAKDQFVRFEEDELKRLEAEKTEQLEIVEFVPAGSIDWVYLAGTHWLGPGRGGDRAYKLLSESMQRMNKLAVGRYHSHGKTELVVIRPHDGGLCLHHVHYADEVRAFDEVERPGKVDFKPVEQELADKLVAQLSVPAFQPEKFHDEYKDRVLAAVDEKVAGREVTTTAAPREAQVIDLFEALKRSLADRKDKAANEAPAAEAPVQAAAGTDVVPGAPAAAEDQPMVAKARERKAPSRAKKPA